MACCYSLILAAYLCDCTCGMFVIIIQSNLPYPGSDGPKGVRKSKKSVTYFIIIIIRNTTCIICTSTVALLLNLLFQLVDFFS